MSFGNTPFKNYNHGSNKYTNSSHGYSCVTLLYVLFDAELLDYLELHGVKKRVSPRGSAQTKWESIFNQNILFHQPLIDMINMHDVAELAHSGVVAQLEKFSSKQKKYLFFKNIFLWFLKDSLGK